MIVRSFSIIFSLLITVTNISYAAVDAQQIKAAVSNYLDAYEAQLAEQYPDAERIEYQISSLDSRLTMAECSEALSVTRRSTKTLGRINTKVSCDSDTVQWSIYVPVEINIYQRVVTTTKPIARNQILGADDLDLREADISQLRGGYFFALDEVIGMVAKRNLIANKAIDSQQLKPPIMIKKGEAVILNASTSGLTVKMPGVALNDGRHGEQISVRNTQSKRIVDAKVIAPGQVAVTM